MLYTTFRLAKEAGACTEKYKLVAESLGGVTKYGKNTPVPLTKIIEICGLEDALWTLRCTTENSDKLARIFACDCAWRVLPLYESKYPDDKRVRTCIETARKFALGEATKEETAAARAAAWAAWAARDAARAAAWAARDAARAAAWAARDAAGDAAWAAGDAAWAARDAARDAARAAAWDAEIEWQTKHLIELLESG